MKKQSRLLTLAEASKYLNIAPSTLRDIVKKESLIGVYKIGRLYRIDMQELLEFASFKKNAPNASKKEQEA